MNHHPQLGEASGREQGVSTADNADSSVRKDLSLESLRGLAALIVVLWHCTLGFAPEQQANLQSTPYYGLIYGPAAVTFFFVLSGFVLTRAFLTTGDWSILTRGAIKRWPRLAGPVLATTLFSVALGASGAYYNQDVSRLTGSRWLQTFGNAPEFGGVEPLVFSIKAAFSQGLLTFFTGSAWLDTSLWTMRFEFVGSMIAFGLGAIVYFHRKQPVVVGYMFLLSALACHYIHPMLVGFPVGVAIAAFLRRDRWRLPGWCSALAIVLCLYLLGFTKESHGDAYAWLNLIMPERVGASYVHILASALIVATAEMSVSLRTRLSGDGLSALGEWSFPLYLVHVPILCSAGCLAFVSAPEGWSRPAAYLATIFASALAAYPLVLFNRKWVRALNRLVMPMSCA